MRIWGKKTSKPANNALALLVRGLFSNWKQLLCFMFTNVVMKADDVKIIILDTIYHLLSINLHVLAVVSDQGSNVQKAINLLGVSIEEPHFTVNNNSLLL